MKTIIEIENKHGKVRLNETVTKDSIGRMIDEIGRLFGATAAASGEDFGTIMNAAENAVDILDIEINSPGGSVFDGYTLYHEIKSLRDRGVIVNATITGVAASMASVIAMAASKVRIVQHGRMMIHDASGEVRGNANKLRETADLLDGISADIANIYSERTGKPIEEIRDLMKKETWMNAAACIENGFADERFDIRATSRDSMGMKLIQAIKDLLPSVSNDDADKLAAHVAEVEILSTDLADAQAKIAELQNLAAVVAEKDSEISNLAASVATLQSEIEAKANTITELEDSLTQAQADTEAAKASAGSQAIEVLAAIGQTTPLPEAETGAASKTEISNLKGIEKVSAFFAAKK